jgi:hypothetical protein
MPGRDPGASRAGLPHEHGHPSPHARSSRRTPASTHPYAPAILAPRGLLGGRVLVSRPDGLLHRSQRPLRSLRGAGAPVLAHAHGRLRGLRGRRRGEPPARRTRVRLVRPACRADPGARPRGRRGTRLHRLEVARRPAGGARSHRRRARRHGRDRHGLHRRSGRRAGRRAEPPLGHRRHDQQHRRPRARAADRTRPPHRPAAPASPRCAPSGRAPESPAPRSPSGASAATTSRWIARWHPPRPAASSSPTFRAPRTGIGARSSPSRRSNEASRCELGLADQPPT